jgi:hypothetical protein
MQSHPMLIDEFSTRVRDLVALSVQDREAAAVGADELRIDALRAIANGAPDAVAIADAALRTVDQDVGGD